ncbi:hypothetical protein GOODEAATRI_031342 [Goodea atripinnis]|uniref:Uncharacterized protein n=1 Tax=Goodea atripinnis TaxID=208336 RepID=A0ABV0MM77_9TELE
MHRERKSELKQMAGGKDLSRDMGNRYDNAGHTGNDPTFPPPYRPSDASPTYPYPSLQTELRALQMADLDLDSLPPPAAGQPANLPAIGVSPVDFSRHPSQRCVTSRSCRRRKKVCYGT